MAVSRVAAVETQFRERITALKHSFKRVRRQPNDAILSGNPLTQKAIIEIFEAQLASRQVDIVARELKNEGEGFYSIGSSGHEGNAMLGHLTRSTDPAFLHYRSGGFYFARSFQVPGETPFFNTALSLTASMEDPIAGGRHKVWGSESLHIPPQTSTIASHLPKALGMAFFLDRRKAVEIAQSLPKDTIVVCTFGDASANHATAQAALNSAACFAFQHLPVPVLFVCEDNGIGISVRTPDNWVRANYRNRAGLIYRDANGLDVTQGYAAVRDAVDICRQRRRPVFLHLKTVRLLGHAGSDVETTYHTKEQIEANEANDPVLKTALSLIEHGVMSPEEILERYDRAGNQMRAAGEEAKQRPKHTEVATVIEPIEPDYQARVLKLDEPSAAKRTEHWGKNLPESRRARHLAMLLNWALHDLALQIPELTLFGEDVAKKGGVYNVTTDLYQKFGASRIFNTLLDETTILGMAIGASHAGLLPMPEIQYLAYLHNAIDQIRGEASTMRFFSDGRYSNPMVVRIASFAYQKGFGGHFHNDNAFAALREIPGIVIVTAANGADAVRAMRSAVAIAKQHQVPVIFMEPIALYMTKDLVEKGDYLFDYPEPTSVMPFGEVAHYGNPKAKNLIISYANGTYLSRQAQHDLQLKGIETQLLDLRFLKPLNREAILEAAVGKEHIFIVEECRQTGSLSEEITTTLAEHFQTRMPNITRICGVDTFIPLGKAWEFCLPSRVSIVETIEGRVNHG
jgi:2-oxoisovalerate dehydrogenase E1 component